ncbi:hypothetical protein [Nocardioides luteus]|uniref:Uncharacterized protein n=1 Tax=Nocardioides luteus TaxID=1844 RepID=A0A1J4N986_9ACTN|nr:hypothetical protein [Nocardioides luteus]OIJ28037.1 hypothetical protein UG56_004880 [Nocardioides luteus]
MSPASQQPADEDRLAWSKWPQACWLIACGRTRRPALRVALVVGALLSLVNQSDAILHRAFSWELAVRIAANFAIPTWCRASGS